MDVGWQSSDDDPIYKIGEGGEKMEINNGDLVRLQNALHTDQEELILKCL